MLQAGVKLKIQKFDSLKGDIEIECVQLMRQWHVRKRSIEDTYHIVLI